MPYPAPRLAVLLCSVLAVACAPDGPDDVPRIELGEPETAFPEPFGLINTIRPLPDGRILVADPLGQALLAIDMDEMTADTIGRQGAGPGEYDQPDAVFPLPGDSTLLTDLGNGRLIVLGPEFEHGATMPIALGDPTSGELHFVIPRGTDGLGRIYFQGTGIRMGGPGGVSFPDSAPIMRFDRGSATIDTLAMVKLRQREAITSGNRIEVAEYGLSPEDAWHVAIDGHVAAARTAGYYLEWIGDAGRRRGPDLAYDAVPVQLADQLEWIDALFATSMSMNVRIVNGVRRTGFSRGFGTGDRPPPEQYRWPDAKAPFIADGVRVSPGGEAWVHRSTPANSAVVYDVFDGDGLLTRQVVLPYGYRVIGFAGEFVFAARRDELDLFWLARFRVM